MFKRFKLIAAMSAMFFSMFISMPSLCAQNHVVLKAGTPIVLETVSACSSKTSLLGSVVDFKVVNDVKVGDIVVVPAGTIAKGQVSSVNKASALGAGGEISLSLSSVNALDGTMIPLSGSTTSVIGKDKRGLSIVCGICTLFGFLIRGDQAVIPAGTQIQPVVMSNTEISL